MENIHQVNNNSVKDLINQNFRNTDGIIFVLDSADYRSFEQAKIGIYPQEMW